MVACSVPPLCVSWDAVCFVGRGKFQDWGGWFVQAYNPTTFTGFIDWCMIIFGLAYVGILSIALKRHDALENAA